MRRISDLIKRATIENTPEVYRELAEEFAWEAKVASLKAEVLKVFNSEKDAAMGLYQLDAEDLELIATLYEILGDNLDTIAEYHRGKEGRDGLEKRIAQLVEIGVIREEVVEGERCWGLVEWVIEMANRKEEA